MKMFQKILFICGLLKLLKKKKKKRKIYQKDTRGCYRVKLILQPWKENIKNSHHAEKMKVYAGVIVM